MDTQVPRRERRKLEKLRRKHAKRLSRSGAALPRRDPPGGAPHGPPPATSVPVAGCRDPLLQEAAQILACWEQTRGWMLEDPVGAICRAVGFAGAEIVALVASDPTHAFAGTRLYLRVLRRETSPPREPVRARAQEGARVRDLLATIDAARDPDSEDRRTRFLELVSLALRSCYPAQDAGRPLRQGECEALALALWTVIDRGRPALVLHAARTLLWSTSDLPHRRREGGAPEISEEDLALLQEAPPPQEPPAGPTVPALAPESGQAPPPAPCGEAPRAPP